MGLKKSKKVSWASGPNLCQVKHYRKEDCPSKVGKRSQHHPHLKQMHCLMKSKERFSYRSLAKWKCPPKFNLNDKWQVVSGEDSKEAGDQEHREKRVIEVVCPSRHAIPPNPYTSSDLDQTYDDNQTPVIRIIPIEEETNVGVSFHLTPSQTISSKLPDACLTYSPSSSVSIVTSQKLPANGKSLPQSLSTFQNPRKPLNKSPFSVRWPSNVESTSHLKGSEQTKVSPKPPISCNSVPQYISTPDQTEIFPDQIANQNHGPKYRTICENQNIRQLESQVSEMPPAKHNPVTKSPSTCDLTVAVATAITALAKNQEQGSLIDANLLVRLLLNPEEIPKLMNEHGSANNAATGAATADSFIGIMSRPVDQLIPLPRTKTDKVINKPINERQAPYAGSGPSFGPKPMAKFAPLTMTKPETSVKSSLVNEQGAPPHLGIDNAGGKPLVNSELVPSSCSKYDVVLSSADHRTTLQPKLSLSPNVGHTSPLSSMTSPTPLRKDINYCKSLYKFVGWRENCCVAPPLLQQERRNY